MPRKRDESLLIDLLEVAPAWVGPVLAVAAFLGLRFLLPAILAPVGSEPMGKSLGMTFGTLCRGFAPWAFGLILVAWAVIESRKWITRRMFDKQEGLGSIRSLSWEDLERLVGEAYRRKGYAVEETGSAGGDGGVDLVLRGGGRTILVQCKQWRAWTVGVRPVRELRGVVAAQKADSGILVTCGRFTRGARDFAEGNAIELVGGPALASLVAGVQAPRPAAKAGPKTAPPPAGQAGAPAAKAGPKAAPPAANPAAVPSCPQCGAKMVLRTAGKGAHQGKPFWGCPGYPTCRGIRDAG